MVTKKLTAYARKRNFKKTTEPNPTLKLRRTGLPVFVIQEHHASHLHYDLRLEMDGVLKSWAVPKGPSLDPAVRRLAALTEDHPMAYSTFEGIIPEGYGAGTVIVWDTGTFENISEKGGKPLTMEQAFEKGHIKVFLHGRKLNGEFSLIKFRPKDWLLIKGKDKFASKRKNPVSTKKQSVLSKKTIALLDKKFKRS